MSIARRISPIFSSFDVPRFAGFIFCRFSPSLDWLTLPAELHCRYAFFEPGYAAIRLLADTLFFRQYYQLATLASQPPLRCQFSPAEFQPPMPRWLRQPAGWLTPLASAARCRHFRHYIFKMTPLARYYFRFRQLSCHYAFTQIFSATPMYSITGQPRHFTVIDADFSFQPICRQTASRPRPEPIPSRPPAAPAGQRLRCNIGRHFRCAEFSFAS